MVVTKRGKQPRFLDTNGHGGMLLAGCDCSSTILLRVGGRLRKERCRENNGEEP
jgi:hypothetical protein